MPILGFETAGQVEAVGSAVSHASSRATGWSPRAGSTSAATPSTSPLPSRAVIARIPDNLSYQDAAALCFGGTTALIFFRLGKLARW